MRASELVKALEAVIAESGDRPVIFSTREEAYEISHAAFEIAGYNSETGRMNKGGVISVW